MAGARWLLLPSVLPGKGNCRGCCWKDEVVFWLWTEHLSWFLSDSHPQGWLSHVSKPITEAAGQRTHSAEQQGVGGLA